MFVHLRQQGWLAALLLILSPGLGGIALPLVNPCPVDAPWIATTAEASTGHHGGGHGSHGAPEAADSEQGGHQCSCISCCSAPSRPEPPAITIAAEVVTAPVTMPWPVVEGRAPSWHVLQLLPEATAPPLV